jgi:protein HIRA/HIR1
MALVSQLEGLVGYATWDCGSLSDHKVKIWSTLPILDETADSEANPKLLCTMTTHSGKFYAHLKGKEGKCKRKEIEYPGSVLAVRWAHSGRFLASGSDDMVLVIWGIDP